MLIVAICFPATVEGINAETKQQASRRSNFCFDWKFLKGDAPNAQQADFDDSGWENVNLPHDWSIEGPKDRKNPGGKNNGFFPGGIGWYRKHFRLLPAHEGKKVFVQFDGIYQNSEVWINGHSLGVRPYGYISFEHDLTPYVKFDGDNILSVRVDNTDQPNCRWYTGSGIYRYVWLTITDKLHVRQWGTYVTVPSITPTEAVVRVRTEVENSYEQPKRCTLITRILDAKAAVAAEAPAVEEISGQGRFRFEQELRIPNPKLWSIDSPVMYSIQTFLKDENGIYDEYETPFGIRQIQFEPDKGFLLNGKPVKMKGVCIHHDTGCLGAAVPVRAWERRLEILKSIGCNAIRASHNPPAPEMLDLCDRMGFVVIDEAFDKWGGQCGRWFKDWGRKDLTDMLRRDRNHPSVIIWSVGNEVSGQGSSEFNEQLKALADLTRELEPTRPVTYALMPFKIKSREENAKIVTKVAKLLDVTSCNYQEHWFEDYRKEYPQIIIIASESYPFYCGKDMRYDAFEPLNPWLEVIKHDYVAGAFYWAGIDYLGEAVAGWPYHGWNCSLIDTCGFVRPIANLHKSFWIDKPMVHIAVMDDSLDEPKPTKAHWGWPKTASHWNLPQLEGKQVKVVTFTNCSAVELFVNGTSAGIKELQDFPDKMITWTVPYEPGQIEAHGIEQGSVVCSHHLQTAGRPAEIRLIADREKIHADGHDLCHVEVQITDEKGILVPAADHEIQFQLEGPATIIGVDNGDITSIEPFKARKRKAFHGKALVIIQSSCQPGPITLRAKTEGLPETKIMLATVE